MPALTQELFQKLQNAAAILALVGHTEDVHLDCKEWPTKHEEAQRVFAKAVCGLSNAEGGVLVVGMRAKHMSKDEPDQIVSAVRVSDTAVVKSRILELIGQLVEPGVEGIDTAEVNDPPGSKSGFVVVHVPACDGPPRRSRKDRNFYLRIGSATLPMEYFQIADMFGERPKPRLELYLEPTGEFGTVPHDQVPHRYFWLGLTNVGRGLAKFPGVRFKQTESAVRVFEYGVDGNMNYGLPKRVSDGEWVIFGGGVDDVIYPGTTLKVTQLVQKYSRGDPRKFDGIFDAFSFNAELMCESLPTISVEKLIPKAKSK